MGSSSMKLGVIDNDGTSGLLADVTVTTVTLTAEHGQMTLLGYVMMSGLLADITMRAVTLAA